MRANGKISVLLFAAAWAFTLGSFPAAAQRTRPRLSDAMITTMINHRLMDKMVLRKDNIQVLVQDAAVTLTGTVRSLAERKLAGKEAQDADDVASVRNELRIATEDRTDRQIAEDLGSEIRRYVFYDIFDWIEGSVEQNVVTLRGSVREPWRKADYERLAEGIAGVTAVKNQLEVLPLSTFDDQLRITTARRLYGDPRFVRYANRSLPPIHIIVKNGRITLEGAVATPLERQLAESIVRTNSLSFEVVNRLQVEKSG
jgi:hyperosmotically inducible protein